MTSGSAFEHQSSSDTEENFVDASSRLHSRSNSGFSFISTDEEGGYFTPGSTLSRRSSVASISKPMSGFLGGREMPVSVPPLHIRASGEGATQQFRDAGAETGLAKPRWAESWSQSPSLQSSMNESQAFQPLRTSVRGERKLDADVSRRTTEDSCYSQPTARTHLNSPHAAAASRRFLAPSGNSFRGAGDPRGTHTAATARAFPGRYAAVEQSMTPPLEHGVRTSSTQAEMKDEEAAAAAPGRLMQDSLAAKLPAGLTDDSERDEGRPGARWSIPAAPNPCGGEAVKMGRHEAWARFLAYEAAMQICLRASREGNRVADHFLESGCAVLRRAYAFEGLLLQPVNPGSAPCGATLVWDDSEAAVLPTVGFGPTVTREATVRCVAERLQSSALYRPARGGRPGAPPQLYISLRPSRWQQGGSWTLVSPDGKGATDDVVELSREDMSDDLLVEVTTESGERVAHGTVPIADVWGAAGSQFSVEQPRPVERRRWCLPCWSSAPSAQSDIFGKKWITLLDVTDARYGHALLSAWISNTEKTVITAAEISPETAGRVQDMNAGALPKGYQQITGWEVYDLSLHAALAAQGCGPRQLEVKGEWEWLLEEFAATYGIRSSYTTLAHLLWAIRKENATVTAYCFSMLNSKLVGLKQAEAEGCLLPQELPLLGRIEIACEDLLARCMENYYALSENAPSGIAENGMDTSEQPAPALVEAVLLCRTVSDVLQPSEAGWFTERFQIAAVKRYGRLQAACTEQIYSAEARQRANRATADGARNYGRTTGPLQQTAPAFDPPAAGGSDAEMAYRRLQAICSAMRQELDSDLRIHETRKLPTFVILPQVTAAEYGRLFVADLMAALEQHPPPQPSQPAVDLLVSVGQQQKYLDANGLLPPAGHPGALDALQVFGPHVTRWINGSKSGLCARCRQIETTTMASALHPDRITEEGKSFVAPLVEEMLQRIGSEVGRYERVIAYWHVFGPLLEGAVCASLRETTGAVTRQCGLSQVRGDEQRYANGHAPPGVHARTGAKFGNDDRSPSRWKWNATVAAVGQARLTVLPHEAVLLNSLRKLLSVVPQTEYTIAKWAGGVSAPPSTPSSSTHPASPPRQGAREMTGLGTERMPSGSDGPELGAQFAQLVKELRSEYAGAVQACAARIAQGVFGPSGRSILRILQQHGITGTPSLMQQQVGPVLEAMEEVILGLTRTLDGRVYVALGRGLWDFTAKEIFDYVESLQEGKESQGAWRGRQNAAAALDVVDNFFCTILSSTLQGGLQAKDLDLPLHSDRAHKLLAANTAAINMSYTVY